VTDPIEIRNIPIFEEGTFREHAAVFKRFLQHAPDYMLRKFHRAQAALAECEGVVTWPLIVGPGFSGATHPGADNILIETMYAGHRHIYNSDCLYINPAKRVFAVSDPPGVTVSARMLLGKLDEYLLENEPDTLGLFINNISRDTAYADTATLCLVYVPKPASRALPVEAIAFNAGDSYLFHGNRSTGRLTHIDGNPQFIGSSHAHFESQHLRLEADDVFIVASDGIAALSVENKGEILEPSMVKDLEEGLDVFVTSAIERTNAYFEQEVYGRTIPRFGGNDNGSILVIHPSALIDAEGGNSFLLGGYVPDR